MVESRKEQWVYNSEYQPHPSHPWVTEEAEVTWKP